ELMPGEREVAGLLALMLLHDSRREARTTAEGDLVPLEEQDRTRWDRERIDEGLSTLARTTGEAGAGPYELQARIAAEHAGAPDADSTDWRRIAALYERLAGM